MTRFVWLRSVLKGLSLKGLSLKARSRQSLWLQGLWPQGLYLATTCGLMVVLPSTAIVAAPIAMPPRPTVESELAIETATCQLDSTIERNRRLEVTVPQHCVDQRLGLALIIEDARDRANAFAQSAGNVPLEVREIDYETIAGGVRVRADLGIDNPLLGFLDVRVFQDVMASVESGRLSVEAGETRLVLDVPIFGGGELEGIARSVVDQQLQVLDGKRLSELAIETGLDRVMAEQSGLSREAVNFIVSSVEDDIDIDLTPSGANVAIEFR